MNKSIVLPVLALLSVLMIGIASAIPICSTVHTTYVAGVIYHEGSPVEGADVTVTCNGHAESTTSASDGSYSVEYLNTECKYGDAVTVTATKDSLTGSSNDVVDEQQNTTIGCLKLIVDVACTDVTLIPEFGLIVGTLTVLSAVAAFFIIRRK